MCIRDRTTIGHLSHQIKFLSDRSSCCSRIIDSTGVRMNPRNIGGIISAQYPKTGTELFQYIHALTWMATTIPKFAERFQSLRKLLENTYSAGGGKRTKKSISNIRLSYRGWDDTHAQGFDSLQQQLHTSVRLKHRDVN